MAPGFKIKALGLDLRPENPENEVLMVNAPKVQQDRKLRNGGIKPFLVSRCPLCGMTVRGRPDYLRHKEAAHNEKRPYEVWNTALKFL